MEQFQQYLGGTTPSDPYGEQLEALNGQIASAGGADIPALLTKVQAINTSVAADAQYSAKYSVLIAAQALTLEALDYEEDFRTESASIAASGTDCSKNYSYFIGRMRSANATANAALAKARSYLSSNPNSTATVLVSAVEGIDVLSMVTYAQLIEDELELDCPASKSPSQTYALPISSDDALDIASEAAGTDYFVYGLDSQLPAGTVITAIRGAEDFNYTLAAPSWFFFLDSQPEMPFGHDVKYIIVDVATGDYSEMEEQMYPLIDGAEHWKSIDERSDPSNVLYPENAEDLLGMPIDLSAQSGIGPYRTAWFMPLAGEGAAAALPDEICCLEKDKYALIMTGSTDDMFKKDTANMYNHLKANGYGDGDISYLTATAETPGSDGVTSVAKLAEALRNLAKAECCDEVFIYLAGHGSKQPVRQYKNKATGNMVWVARVAQLGPNPADNWEATGATGDYHKIDVNGGYATADALNVFLKDIKSCHITIVYQSCFSGAAVPTLRGSGRAILTPVDAGHSSYGSPAGSTFTSAYIAAKGAANGTADKNHDGTVTEKEAFDYADKTNHDRIEDVRDYWQDKADAEADPVKKAQYQAKANGMQEQFGQYSYTACTCCFMDCNKTTNYLCQAFVGMNKASSPLCKKIGDYCANDTATGPEDGWISGNGTANDTAGNGSTTGGGAGGEGGVTVGGGGTETVPPVCGDGNITGAESCDYGSTATNKCPEGEYCHDSCICKKLETSVVCGDGKISSPGEDCDGGNVKFKLCPTGYNCHICKCIPVQAACGDGTVTPPEECDHGNSYTSECPSGKTCHGCKCVNPEDVPPTEAYCGNNKREGAEECDGTDASACHSDEHCSGCACVEDVECGDGDVEGSEECERDSHCSEGETCSNCMCVEEPPECGNGDIEAGEECEDDGDCSSGEHCSSCHCVTTPTYCGDGEVNGNEECDPDASPSGCSEPSVCGANCRCVDPPTLNCDSICANTPGAQSFGGSYGSASECGNAVKSYYGTQTCYLTCSYSWYYKVTNIAGSASCCCGMKKMFPCDDCPGTSPSCPGQETCDANAPSWYSP